MESTPDLDDPARIVPHRGPMLFLDRVVAFTASRTVTEMVVGADSPWVRGGLLIRPALIELAAQTAAAGAGLEARKGGRGPSGGFLGAVSDARFHDDARVGDHLLTRVEVGFRMGRLARCSFSVRRDTEDGPLLAEGELSLVRHDAG